MAIPLLGIAFLSDISSHLGYVPWREQYVIVILGLALGAVFVSGQPGRKSAGTIILASNVVISVISVAVGLYSAWKWPEFAAGRFAAQDLGFALTLIFLLLEATRRRVGYVMLIIGSGALAFGLLAHFLPAPLTGRAIPWRTFAMYLYTDTAGIVGAPVSIAATVVLAFILFGTVLFVVGGGQVFIDLSIALVGRFRGGPAKAAVVASALFGTISGSAISNVVTTGMLTIPLMKRMGYPSHIAAGIESVASTGGQLLPPVMGATAFLMADFLGIPYAEVALAALVPGVLYYFCLFVQVHLEAAKNGIAPMSRSELPALLPALRRSWILVIPLGLLVYLLFVLYWDATKAGLAAAALAFVLGVIERTSRIGPAALAALFEEVGQRMLDIVVICALVGIVIGALSITGMGFTFAAQLVALSGGELFPLLIITALVALLLGMGMPTAAVYVLLAVLAAPALVEVGVEPMAAHLFVLYFGMLSMITPPICLAVFAAAPIANAGVMASGFAAMRLAGASYIVPFVFVLYPLLLLKGGTDLEIARAVATAFLAMLALGAALVGYLIRPLAVVERAILGVAFVLLLLPDAGGPEFPLAGLTDIMGLALLAAMLTYLFWHAHGRTRE